MEKGILIGNLVLGVIVYEPLIDCIRSPICHCVVLLHSKASSLCYCEQCCGIVLWVCDTQAQSIAMYICMHS